MSERITQGLRDAMATGARLTEFDGHILDETIWANRAEFENLCDAIDAIHANLERENDRLKCELDRVLGELDEMHKTDGISNNSGGFMHNAEHHAWAPESHYVMLPKDKDGEPVHIGDVMEWPTTGDTFEVVGIGDGTLFYVDGEEDALADWTGASTKLHHHDPTVEDVLREFYSRYCITKPKEEDDAILADFAAKLRLAGDAE